MKRFPLFSLALLTLTIQCGAVNAQTQNAPIPSVKTSEVAPENKIVNRTEIAASENSKSQIEYSKVADAKQENAKIEGAISDKAISGNGNVTRDEISSSPVEIAPIEYSKSHKKPETVVKIGDSMVRNSTSKKTISPVTITQNTAILAKANDSLQPREVQLPSARPSGDVVNDTIYFTWYRARNATDSASPAVVLLHPLGSEDQSPMHKYARFLASRGISSAVITLPFHGRRLARGKSSASHFISTHDDDAFRGLSQSAADVRTVVDWMTQQPEVDARRIGGVGLSLGAIVLHIVMGQDARVAAGVAVLGGGDLARGFEQSPLRNFGFITRYFGVDSLSNTATETQKARLNEIDPIAFANVNRPRRVLMIEAARDLVIAPRNAETLWKALGKPPIQWVDTNHFAPLNLGTPSIERAALIYLNAVWNGEADTVKIPRVKVPTIKFGLISGLDSKITPAIQWQFFGIGTRNHRRILHADAGLSGRGPFLGIAATVSEFVDIGAARRLNGDKIRPYVSFNVAY